MLQKNIFSLKTFLLDNSVSGSDDIPDMEDVEQEQGGSPGKGK